MGSNSPATVSSSAINNAMQKSSDCLAKYRRAQTNLFEALQELREVCQHIIVVEAPYIPEGMFFGGHPPLRLCKICGVEEEGWAEYEFKYLHGPHVRKVTRDELYSFRMPVGGRVLLQ